MKFKYYLRGAGIGIIAATLILSVAYLFKRDMSDAEIIQRALELGMVMEEGGVPGTLGDLPQQEPSGADAETVPEETGEDAGKEDGADEPESRPADSDSKEEADSREGGSGKKGKDTSAEQEPSAAEPDEAGSDSTPEDGQQSDKVLVTIVGGDVSRTVSAKVFEAGLVDSADAFNDFLGDNGYDNLLQPGTYEVTRGATFQEIADMITTR